MRSDIIYGRHGYSAYGQRLTFTSWDVADLDPCGWERGWLQEGQLIGGCRLVLLSEPSWRVPAPVAANRVAA